jgi:hypothetical protein
MKSHLEAPHRRLAQTALADNTLAYLGGYLAPSKDYFRLSHEDLKVFISQYRPKTPIFSQIFLLKIANLDHTTRSVHL